jgi:hypothetical protein
MAYILDADTDSLHRLSELLKNACQSQNVQISEGRSRLVLLGFVDAAREEGLIMDTRSELPTAEMLTDPEAHIVVRCSWCKRYFDTSTQEYTKRPEKDCGDGICAPCAEAMLKDLPERKWQDCTNN